MCGPVAGESGMVGGAKVAVEEEALPGGISSGEDAMGSSGTGSALIGSIGSRVKLVRFLLPVRGSIRGARLGAVDAIEKLVP